MEDERGDGRGERERDEISCASARNAAFHTTVRRPDVEWRYSVSPEEKSRFTYQLLILVHQEPVLALQLAHVDVEAVGPLQEAPLALRYHGPRLFRIEHTVKISPTHHFRTSDAQQRRTTKRHNNRMRR